MTTTNAKRQAAYKDRMRKEGFIPIHIWIRPEWKNVVRGVIDRLKAGEANSLK